MYSSDSDSDESFSNVNFSRKRLSPVNFSDSSDSDSQHSRSVSPDYDIQSNSEVSSGGEDTDIFQDSDSSQSQQSHLSEDSFHSIENSRELAHSEVGSDESGGEQSIGNDHFEDSEEDSDDSMPRRSTRLSRASFNSSMSESSGAGTSSHDANNSLLDDSNDTVDYNIPPTPPRTNNNSQVIEINDTQVMDDDDVILIPQHIETIDLCTQALPGPHAFRVPVSNNEVIEIVDSPLTQVTAQSPRQGPSRSHRGRLNAREAASPYVIPKVSTSAPQQKRLAFDDSMDEGATQSVKISCPICFESIVGRQPVSTTCGHLFCKQCLKTALQTVKKCPMCKKNLKPANIHDIYLGV